MLEPFLSLFQLRWTNESSVRSLPPSISRTCIPSSLSSQKLELLVAAALSPTESHTDPPPILFLHGGFGSASVYIPFLTHFSAHYQTPHATYSLSLRGRGASYPLSYLRLVYGTTLDDLATDLSQAVQHIITVEQRAPLIVAHSSGGGLIQHALARSLLQAKIPGLVLLDAVPNFGNLQVYSNWAHHDPWFILRMLIHLNHVASPLSSTALIRNAFFGSTFIRDDAANDNAMTKKFRQNMAPYESLLWPLQMMKGLTAWLLGQKEQWLNCTDILKGIAMDKTTISRATSSNDIATTDKICIVMGSEDVLMDMPSQKRMVEEYRESIRTLVSNKKVDAHLDDEGTQRSRKEIAGDEEDGYTVDSADGVRFVVVKGAGHHVQNDVQWEKAAEAIRVFAEQL